MALYKLLWSRRIAKEPRESLNEIAETEEFATLSEAIARAKDLLSSQTGFPRSVVSEMGEVVASGDDFGDDDAPATVTVTSKQHEHPLRELWIHRALIGIFTSRILRLRYKGSVLGVFWSILLPLVQVALLTIVIGNVLGAGPKNLSAYILCAFLPWVFISTTLPDAASSILMYEPLLKKIYFPREILPIACVAANFVHFLISLGVFLFYRYIFTWAMFGWPGLPPLTIFWLPVVTLDLVALTLGLSLVFCAWTTFYEDVKYLVTTGLQLVFYVLPVMYFSENIFYSPRGAMGKRWILYHVFLANPLAWIVTAFKQMFFSIQIIGTRGGAPIYTAPFDLRYLALTTATCFLTLFVGYRYFENAKWKFSERT